ncbi:APC family permease [Erythrobacter sp. sf7]|uniref:APC family permease n=1 Tax=Erythrobacter fulvus TaxID=2987523 RepID=A0ABT5JS24_9SPHN|nr:APC family permease [Erythrobacter fulvus]MDC8755567.1 APC family permease [Erythrobacter fulvus]
MLPPQISLRGEAVFLEKAVEPPRVVGPVGATLMSINGMIGAGIFAVPALLYAEVGNFAPWMFLIFGLFYACGTLIVARLCNMFRSSGGPQLWIQAAFGPFAGFLIGFWMVLGISAGRAATLYVLVAYLAVIFPVLAEPGARALALAFLLVALTGIVISGMRNSIGSLAVGTVFKLAPILLLCVIAYASGGIATQFTLPRFGQFESVALLVYFAFSGAEAGAFSAGELKRPRRDLPLTMLGSLALITAFYMAVQWAFIAAGAPQSDGDATPLAAAAGAVMGDTGVLIISVAAVFSIATNALNYFIGGPRVVFGMADRGLLPATFAHVSPRFRTPDRAVLLFAAVTAIMLSSGAFVFLAQVTSLASTVTSLLVIASFVILMRRTDERHNGRLALYWWPVMAVSGGFTLFTMIQAPASAFGLMIVLLIVGTGLYFAARRKETRVPSPEFD